MGYAIGTILIGAICEILGIYKNKECLVITGFVIGTLPFWIVILFFL